MRLLNGTREIDVKEEKDREKEKKRGKIFSIHGESMKKYEVTETTALGTGIFRVRARYSIRIEEMTDRSRKLLGRFYQAAALSRYNLSYRCKRDSGKTKITTTSWKSIELTLHSQPVLKWEEQRGGFAFNYSERNSTYLPVSLKNKITAHNNDADGIEIIQKKRVAGAGQK